MVPCKSRIPADPQLESGPSTVLGPENNYGIPATLMWIISDWNWSELGWWRWLQNQALPPNLHPTPAQPSTGQPRPRKSVIISQQQRHRPICHPPPGPGLARSGAVLMPFVVCSCQSWLQSLILKLAIFWWISIIKKAELRPIGSGVVSENKMWKIIVDIDWQLLAATGKQRTAVGSDQGLMSGVWG